MRFYLLLTLTALLLLTGCSPEVRPEKLSPDEKRLIYHSVQDEIEHLIAEGDMLNASGYYNDAADAYERVNFYEDRAVIPVETIRKIRIRAKANGKHYYNRALKYLKKDKKKALRELNKMMRNDPEYKDGQSRFKELKNDPEIRKFLTSLESSLQTALANNMGSANDLKALNEALEKVTKYDDYNPVADRAKAVIEAQRTDLLGEAVRLYNRGSLEQAADKFRLIKTIYKKDRTADRYLGKISAKQELRGIIQKAKKALQEKKYRLAIELTEKAFDIDSGNKEAKNISKQAKTGYEKQIPDLILQAKEYYSKQEFENALKIFQAVLVWDPDDNTSLTYIKKIEQQLETIKSLK